MTYEMKVDGSSRKELAKVIGEISGKEVKYLGVPTCGYQIGEMVLNRDFTLDCPETMEPQEVRDVLSALKEKGFYDKAGEMPEEEVKEPTPAATAPITGLVVNIPLSSMTNEAIINLTDLLIAKDKLFCHALGVENLDLVRTDENLEIRWFEGLDITPEEGNAYMTFISKLCDMARNLKRVNSKEKDVSNEKYAFRCFLLRLGFIGKEYKEQRKILLGKLGGSSAFRDGRKNDEISE